ncbi:MAG: PilZ domain-containing protein [Deltaproteobacteria bacterium]|nr:PilZ domain-containing protein [Deltaproteobacteria bacterium]
METAPLTPTLTPREHPRHPLLESAFITFGNDDSKVQAHDISFGGLSISGVQDAAMGAEGKLCFSFSEETTDAQDAIWLEVRVRWVRGDEAGLMFLGSTREQRRAIELLVDSAAHPV